MTRGRHGCDAVLENGPAAPELRHRCASLHHGRGPHGPAEYKGVARSCARHGELPSDPAMRLDMQMPHTSLPRRRPGPRQCSYPPETGRAASASSWPRTPPRQSFPVAASIYPRFHDAADATQSTTQNGAYFSVSLDRKKMIKGRSDRRDAAGIGNCPVNSVKFF